jgi:hypothetical protein
MLPPLGGLALRLRVPRTSSPHSPIPAFQTTKLRPDHAPLTRREADAQLHRKNTETATANLAKASGVAHALALQVQPSVQHALNSTNGMIDQARDRTRARLLTMDDQRGSWPAL